MPGDAALIAAALREAGVDIATDALAPEPRDGRIVVALPGDRLAWFPTSEDGRALLVHGDLGLHNLALDPDTDAVLGVFDHDDACLADRHRDFRYLVFDHGMGAPLDAALDVYEPATGVRIDRARVLLENAGCALSFLAERRGHASEARPCGRTLAEDLRWVRAALARVS